MAKLTDVPEKASIDEIDKHDVDGFDPDLKPVGYAMKPDNLRPSVWVYESGESNEKHKHEFQEELYTPLEGRVSVSFEDDTVELESGEFVTVPSNTWRRITAEEETTLLVVGAPNESHDAVFPDEE